MQDEGAELPGSRGLECSMISFMSSNRSITISVKTRASKSIHADVVAVRYRFDCKLSRHRFSESSAILILPSETRMRKIEGPD
jgi:hypothetical protein